VSKRLCVLGPSGRMGRMVLELAADDDAVQVVSALDRAGSDIIGRQVAPGVTATADASAALGAADVYIDFTTPAATAAAARVAADRRVAAVIGTTGMDQACEQALAALAETAPVLVAPNFSLGVNVLLGLAEQAARALGAGFDLEVVELHHRRKRDAPSGTAIALGQALARGRGLDYDDARRYSREGEVGARPDDEIGVVAVRGGDIIGEHTAYLIGELERIEISHRAGSRSIFAAGALRAAAWLAGKPAGRYGMRDVLGL
jgi:4-hydroxy-tetrahydrodipicolinate reductase